MFSSCDDLLCYIDRNDIYYVNFLCIDINGSRRVITKSAKGLTKDNFNTGLVLSGSSVNYVGGDSDVLVMRPDLSTTHKDLHCAYPALSIICDLVCDDGSDFQYDSRSVAKRAAKAITECSIADSVAVGAEIRFYVFDDVLYSLDPRKVFYSVVSDEGDSASSRKREYGNHGHRPNDYSSSLCIAQPQDTLFDLRTEIFANMLKSGLAPESHRHGEGPGQCEIVISPCSMLDMCDVLVKAKAIIKGTVASYGKSATFMPKPCAGLAGSGLMLYVDLLKDNKSILSNDLICKGLIGGILKNMYSVAAFTNSSTNSYKRVVSDVCAHSIDYCCSSMLASPIDGSIRVACGFPDAAMNPYLAIPAILVAGMDGIRRSLEPVMPGGVLLPRSLRDALNHLESSHDFLIEGDVLSKAHIDLYVALKRGEMQLLDSIPHPAEYCSHYSC